MATKETENITALQQHFIDAKNYLLEHLGIQGDYEWMVGIFLILFATAIAAFFANRFLNVIAHATRKTASKWDDISIDSARKPLRALIWVVGISLAIDVIAAEAQAEIFHEIDVVREIAVVILIAWGLIRFIRKGEKHFIETRRKSGERVDVTATNAVAKLLKISVLISTALITMQNLGISVSGLLAFGGLGGIAVGFAAKDMLANFFGALIIYFDQPFKVGDWIRSPDQEIEGTVEEIGWRMTTIRTFDMRPLYVPNSVFTTVSVENPSRMRNRRIFETIGVRYDDIDKIQAITDEVREMVESHEEIDTGNTLMVYFNAFNASSCDFFVYCFTKTIVWKEFHAVKHDVLLKIAAIIEKHGAEIAFPTRTLHMVNPPQEEEPKAASKAKK